MRILLLAQHFEPEPAMKGLPVVHALQQAGHHVEVATAFPNYPGGRVYPGYRQRPYQGEIREGIRIHRVPLYTSHDKSLVRRGLTYFSFFTASLLFGLFSSRRFDVVYVCGPTITVGLAASLFTLLTRVPFIVDIQDLWPDSAVASGMVRRGLLSRLLGGICRFIYSRATRIVVQSKGMRDVLISRGVMADKINVIYNWADERLAAPSNTADLARFAFDGHFNIVYAGNLGPSQALESVVRAGRLVSETAPLIRVSLIGDGVETQELSDLAGAIGAHNVRFYSRIAPEQIADVLLAADVLLINLADDPLYEITVPSKTQFALALGKPILIGVRGEAGDLVTDAHAGISVPPENAEAMAAAMVQLSNLDNATLKEMGARGRQAYLGEFSFAAAMAKTVEVVEGVPANLKT